MLVLGVKYNGRDKKIPFQYATVNEINLPLLKDIVQRTFSIAEATTFDLYLYNEPLNSYYEIETTDFPITYNGKFEVHVLSNEQVENVEIISDSGISSLQSPPEEENNAGEQSTVLFTLEVNVNSSLKHALWEAGKVVITMSNLSLASREELEKANLNYQSQLAKNQKPKPHMATYNTKKELADVLGKQLFSFACYPSHDMYVDAAVSLVTSFPCLGSFHETRDKLGILGWYGRLVDKLNEIRRNSTHPEVLANKSK
jgi:hypothetical protein